MWDKIESSNVCVTESQKEKRVDCKKKREKKRKRKKQKKRKKKKK